MSNKYNLKQKITSNGVKKKNFVLILIISTIFISGFLFGWIFNIFQENLKAIQIYQEKQVYQKKITVLKQETEVLNQKIETLKSVEYNTMKNLEFQAKAIISVLVTPKDDSQILFKKNTYQELPIASLVKLMTAYVVLEYYDLSHKVEISEQAILQTGDAGRLKIGQILPIKDLLFPLLIESSNDAAFALAETIGQEQFIYLMNLEARRLGLKNTYFVNPTGLDEKKISNYSTINDLVKFTKHLLRERQQGKNKLLWDILSTKEINLYGQRLVNTNKLLNQIPGIIGGRTGWTSKAGGSLLLVIKTSEGYLINIILGAPTPESRFEEMKKLIDIGK